MSNLYDESGGDSYDYMRNFYIYIGEDDTTYTNNAMCAGSPFYPTITSPWPFGFEIFCNLQGQYAFIVMENIDTSVFRRFSICSLAVYGSNYSRTTAPVSQVIMLYGNSRSFDVEKVVSEEDIGNVLNINLRKPLDGVPLSVSFVEQATLTTVTVNSAVMPTPNGSYILTLQSFDTNSNGVESTLNTVTVSVIVTDFVRDPALPIPTALLIKRGDFATFDVENVYSIIAIDPVDIDLRQLSGTELSFVDLIEQGGASTATTVDIYTDDPALVPSSAVYTLTLESFDMNGVFDSIETLYTDYVTLYITDYIRDVALVSTITMRQDWTFTYDIPHCYAELTQLPGLGYNIDVKLREKPGEELPWATPPTFTYVAGPPGYTTVLLDAT